MSTLENTFDSIKTSLSRPSGEYAEARARCAALAQYETPAALAAALRDPATSTPRREVLVAVVLEEHQRARRPFWQSVLLAGFEPTLTRLRSRAGRPAGDDWDQEILLAFLDAAATLESGPNTLQALLWLTEAKMKRATRRDRRAQDHGTFEDDKYETPFADHANARLAAEDVMEIIEKRGGPELLRAVLATEVAEETLDAYVSRTYSGASPAERARVYKRLRVAKARVLSELRARAIAAAAA